MSISGGKLAGGNPKDGRVENDYYATDPSAVKMLFEEYKPIANTMLEPCVGGGNISNAVKEIYKDIDSTGIDIVDRGYENTIVGDFLTLGINKKFDLIISNPPYSIAQEFIEKSISLMSDNSSCIMFLKIQFLESKRRKEFFKEFPPKYIYVFSERMATWNNGNQFDKNGKPWGTTMCHAWFIWEKKDGEISKTEPIVRWL